MVEKEWETDEDELIYHLAEMVAEERRIRNLSYEVYRFGGAEIVARNGEKFVALDPAKETITSFFQELFTRHGIKAVLESHSKP